MAKWENNTLITVLLHVVCPAITTTAPIPIIFLVLSSTLGFQTVPANVSKKYTTAAVYRKSQQ